MILLLDFGASRIKAALAEKENNKILCVKGYPAATPCFLEGKKCEISLNEIKEILFKILEDFKNEPIEGIFISSEMHGFLIADKNNTPLTQYISWKDERCLMPFKKGTYYSFLLEKIGEDFRNKTGMTPKPCFPLFNLFALLQTSYFDEEIKILTLSDYLLSLFSNTQNLSHSTMAAGLGFYDIFKKEYAKEFIHLCGENIHFNTVSQEVVVGAYYKDIPVYIGVGDHQCAVLGAGNNEQTISFNLGTGSQISLISDEMNTKTDIRPFFNQKYLHTITHIPSGRALSEYVGFMGTQGWEKLDNVPAQEIEQSSLVFDLAIFNSAVNYQGAKGISNITENTLNEGHYFASLLRSYADQYLALLKNFNLSENLSEIILSGGISRKIPALKEYFYSKTPYQTSVAEITEETFFGLLKIASFLK